MKQKHEWTGPRIRAAREAKGLTQEDLANLLDVSLPTVSRWETGKFTASRMARGLLARILGEAFHGTSRLSPKKP